MTIHITRRELKIKTRLFAALVIILGIMCLLYLVFCKGKGYNQVKIAGRQENTTAETTTAAPETEVTTEKADDVTGEPESETESETKAPTFISWDSYDPLAVLSGDDWMLALINANYPIGKNYTPVLAPIIEGNSCSVDSRVAEAYQKMYADAKAQDIILEPIAGYLPYFRQQENYNNLVKGFTDQGMSEEEAKQAAAARVDAPGCSESGAGLSVDIIGTSSDFDKTKEYAWLMANAYKYGFVLRYPEEKFAITGVRARPWHWRYVGTDAAAEMKAQGLCLEEYLENKR